VVAGPDDGRVRGRIRTPNQLGVAGLTPQLT
jgi:hypothetical protein